MIRLSRITAAGVALSVAAAAGPLCAAPVLRFQADVAGDFVLVGNTLAHDCRAGVDAPVVGMIGPCGMNVNDGAPDVFWQSQDATSGAVTTTAASAARSTSQLVLPTGATVTYARLYWGGEGLPDPNATLAREGAFSAAITADDSWSDATDGTFFQATADVTDIVQQHGAGPYRVSDVDVAALADRDEELTFAGWSLIVVYALPGDASRNITVFDGFDRVADGAPAAASLSGFLVPDAGFDARIGVVAYEGDNDITGDDLRLGLAPLAAGDRLFDAQNPVNGFFNGSRSTLGAATSMAGDLPQLTGAPASMSGLDLDVIDITDRLAPGQTAVDVEATSSGDIYFLGAFVTAITTLKPELGSTSKTAVDVNGGELVVGDELLYRIEVRNTGNDTAVGTVLTDTLPAGVTFVPGSLAIAGGANAGPLSDAVDADQGEHAGGTVTVRLGDGADGSSGGSLAPQASTTVELRVTVDAVGAVSNQATMVASGLLGAPEETFTSDNSVVTVHECSADADCTEALPACDREQGPHLCVECLSDAHCPAEAPVCDLDAQQCGPCAIDAECPEGMCVDGACVDLGSGGGGAGGAPLAITGRYEGSGCRCGVPARRSGPFRSMLLVLAAALARRFARREVQR